MHEGDLFKSTGCYYARFRSGYPDEFIRRIAGAYGLDGAGRLLDLGCGTGQLAIPFARWFEQVVAIDPEPEMLAEARRIAGERGITNIEWAQGSSDDLSPSMGAFRLVTMGACFHWMSQNATLDALHGIVQPGGGVVIVDGGGGGVTPIDRDPADCPDVEFAPAARAVIARHLGEHRRAGSGFYTPPREPYETVIARSHFRVGETIRMRLEWATDVDHIVGFYYSTSFCSPYVLGDKREAFERDLREALSQVSPSGIFRVSGDLGAFMLFRG